MTLSIIILSFNTEELTVSCIKSVLEQYSQELENDRFEIIVVDNASSDQSVNQISKIKAKNLTIVESKENLGFSKGTNLGAKKAKGEFLLFLNSDTEIKDQGLLNMIDFLNKNEKVGILGGKLLSKDGTIQKSVGSFNMFYLLLSSEKLGFLRNKQSKTQRVDWVSGASLMIRKNLFEKTGGFEKELFMYMEDVDLCFKVLKKDFYTYFFSEITLYHNERGSSNRTFAILEIYKGMLFFFKKRKPLWEYFFVKTFLKLKALLLVCIGKITDNKYLTDTYLQALKV